MENKNIGIPDIKKTSCLLTGIKDQLMFKKQFLNISGAGNSRLSEELCEEGFYDQVCIDFSQTVATQMSKKLMDKGININYSQMDVRKMSFQAQEFGVVLDKGCLDCIFCAESSNLQVNKALSEIYRVLNHKGIYILISNGLKEFRQSHLEKFKWKIEAFQLDRPTMNKVVIPQDKDIPKQHTIYICQKNE